MRRRLDLAAALVARPPVIFLDEPTTGLDPRSRIGLWETIEGRVAEGTTGLLTTQDLDESDRLADRISVIDHGTVIAEGTSDELKDQVGGEALEVTLESAAQAEAAIAALVGVCSAPPELDGTVLRVPVAERKGTIAAAVQRLNDAGVGIDDIPMRRATLDDVFLQPTGHAAGGEGGAAAADGDLGHARAGQAQLPADLAGAGPAARLRRAADHVRAALRLRLRRRDPD